VAVLGSTGSIGRQTLEVVSSHPERFELAGIVAGRDREALRAQAQAFGAPRAGLGADDAVDLASADDVDIVLNAIVGSAGLRASVAALESGKVLALANKESLVAGGEACTAAARRGGGAIEPVDSEHAALTQCLLGCDRTQVDRLVLTASGGPFRNRLDVDGVTPEEALAHPTWSMGPKITVDSATLMNKGLEVIEAHFLFGMPYERIEVMVHPQSIVHGMVVLTDGSVVMQAAPPDMRIPIAAALGAPDRYGPAPATLDLVAVGALTFEEVDHGRFPSLALAFDAGREGRSYPAVLNAANEEAVAAFLGGRIGFTDIPRVVGEALEAHEPHDVTDVDAVMEADTWARARAGELICSARAG
jgi:1-deoxy-D-xylulose-5-phosphate reductoisomerase